MAFIKKAFRLLGFVCLLVLASVGVSITPAPPELPKNRKKKTLALPEIEMVEKLENHHEAAEWRDERT